jgi:ribonuclease Z
MKSNYLIKKVNSPFEDTCFFIRNVYKKKALLLDCGRIGSLNNTEILSVSHIFISHTHIDHFYGFDRILRTFLRSDKTLKIYGPKGFLKNIEGKLAGYTWNLVENYNFKIEAFEILEDKSLLAATYKASDAFHGEYLELGKIDKISLDDGFFMCYEFFDHAIPSMAFRIKEVKHVNIKKDVLQQYGYIQGPWLTELKSHLRANKDLNYLFDVETMEGVKKIPAGTLKDQLVIFREPQDITFIADFAPTFENFKKAISFARGSFLLLIESMFLKEQVLHAIDKRHSTIDLSKQIFLESGTKFVHFFHFSSKYEKSKNVFFQKLYEDINNHVI